MNDARQQMLERIGEDESLTGDLGGDAAEALRQWANDTALTIAQRTDLDDDTVQQQIRAVRTAARKAAAHNGDLTVAQHEFAALIAATAAPVPPHQTVTAPVMAPPNQSVVLRLREWWRGMWSRLPKEE